MLWITVLVLVGCFVSGLLYLFWEVLCVLVFWEVEILRVEKWVESVGGV